MPSGSSSVQDLLALICNKGDPALLTSGLFGLEKESLRVAQSGGIAFTPHPLELGSALTHPHITTDYSEALLEFITPPFQTFSEALDCLKNLHLFVQENLKDELLWATSMPCVLAGEDNIPVAQFGDSNHGLMKYIYRVGLGYRYGRVMQVIAGVHFNYSIVDDFWPMYQKLLGDEGSLRDFRDAHYMGMVRNLQRYGWIIPYLFGASPAVCRSFFYGKEPDLLVFDDTTYYEPYATSLRTGDIGYQNRKEEGMGVKACYDNLADYVQSLACATKTPCPVWEEIGVKVDGEYRQLNANRLQIENEYYSSIRPKQIPGDMETPSRALLERGIQYVELRSLDVNAYHPLGMDEQQLRFLHAFMLYCLLRPSPVISDIERKEIDRNIIWVAQQGRDPLLKLQRGGKAVLFRDWANELLDGMRPVAEVLATEKQDAEYAASIEQQIQKIVDADKTPSGRMLKEMRENGEGFYQFARRLSLEQWRYFSSQKLEDFFHDYMHELTSQSLRQQQELEAADSKESLDDFLQRYFDGQI
ncbi:MAG TPA: glutamate--cysteine ligase [Thiolapillus brandeum]|uniref:Glutamate--cysteine ligase n=1 Tax=Thiolapillus brandeum TaxID=1076588 RepID=A0A831K3L1_9GAMM|nr:glutamate--cysteine ligase [Thiolapillus brandeum]